MNLPKFLLFLFVTCYLLLVTSSAEAITMTNDDYILRTELNTAGGKAQDSKYNLGVSVGQTAAGLSTVTGYKVKAGFQYLFGKKSTPFTFTISENLIDFGILSPTNPVTRTNNLTVDSGTATGYSVTAIENRELTAQNGTDIIPDTTCDTGVCSEIMAGVWSNTLTYGFGYRCDNVVGTDCSEDFSEVNTYKQFSNASQNETSSIVMAGSTQKSSNQAKITYRVNISGAQPAGTYSNAITYIATPSF